MSATSTIESELDETELIAALRAGDERAFAWLVRTYHAPLLRLALTHVRSHAVAEEVVQDTWLGLLRGLDRFEGRCSLKTWLFQILLNRARTRGVRERRSMPVSTLVDGSEPESGYSVLEPGSVRCARRWTTHRASPDASPDGLTETHEALDVIARAIEELPPRYRELLVLRDIEQLSSDEASGRLNLTRGNQRVLLHRARSRVRAVVQPYFAEGCP